MTVKRKTKHQGVNEQSTVYYYVGKNTYTHTKREGRVGNSVKNQRGKAVSTYFFIQYNF